MLTKLFDDNCEELARIDSDVVLLARVLWSLVQPQVGEMTANEFMEGLGGDALGQAVEALVRAVADFFTNPERHERHMRCSTRRWRVRRQWRQQQQRQFSLWTQVHW